jgi:hypothetical protein
VQGMVDFSSSLLSEPLPSPGPIPFASVSALQEAPEDRTYHDLTQDTVAGAFPVIPLRAQSLSCVFKAGSQPTIPPGDFPGISQLPSYFSPPTPTRVVKVWPSPG